MKPIVFFSFFCCLVSLVGCKNISEEKTEEPEIVEVDTKTTSKHSAAATDVSFNDDRILAAYEAYIAVKTALVNTDASNTAAQASSLNTALSTLEVEEATKTAVQTMMNAKDVEVQRKAFELVTSGIEKLVDGAIVSGQIYKQYCPMAFDFKGAYWLSNSKEINNPYFGDKMLRCGTVKDTLN